MNLIEWLQRVMVRAGAEWVLWIMIGLSVISVAIILERAWFFSSLKDDLVRLAKDLQVALEDSIAVGWAAAGPVSARVVYRGVVEHSVYVAPRAAGRGVGRMLLAELIRAAESSGVWTIQSSVFPENTASLRLHEHAGFRRVGRRERIALMSYGPFAGRWRDTVLIERRSDDPPVTASVSGAL